MCLEPDQAGAQSLSHPQSQAHPIPLYEEYLCSVAESIGIFLATDLAYS